MQSASFPLPLLIWLSPQFPVGAFAYSHGLEWAVESGAIPNAESLREWLDALLAHGAVRTDAILASCAHRAALRADLDEISAINDLALALAPSRERLLETSAQGNAFLAALQPAWPGAMIEAFARRLDESASDAAYPIAVGIGAAAYGIARQPLCEALMLATLSNLVSAVVRLGPIGQTEAQAIIAGLCPAITKIAGETAEAGLDDCGSAAWGADIASMRHETQYSRIFRS